MKHKDKTTKPAGKNIAVPKVFDVTRPGKMLANATSRPVIVGHKPQVKDPMMSGADDATQKLMDSTQKVTVEPVQSKPKDGPYVADELAAIATSSAIDQPEVTVEPITEPVPTQEQETSNLQAADNTPPSDPELQPQNGSTGLIYDEVPPEMRAPSTDDKTKSTEPLPTLPEEKQAQPQVVVSHHNYSNGWMRFFVTFVILAVVAIIIIDILLDTGLLVKEGLPHTHFFAN